MRNKRSLEMPAAIIAALAVWQIAAAFIGNPLLFVTPLTVASKLSDLGLSAEFWSVVAFSFARIAAGFFLALIAGIMLAVFAGRLGIAEVMLQPYMAAIKSTPVASFIILCLIWLNAKSLPVFISFLMVLPIVYTNVLQGIKNTDVKLLEMAEVFGVNWWRKLHYIYIPHLKSYLLSACSLSIGLAWKSGVAAEVIGIPEGSIGEKLYEAKIYLNTGDLFAWTIAIITVSILFEKMFIRVLKFVFDRNERA